ncbi:MAG: Fur family transcriptional regulator [Candidatus Omnitrophica bacterium]|jgi:Fur family ferric uptake transcriptional regulator|nr:Fur family transcriptional regulator [Candidatus Omnitrophota bacterium]
MPRMDGCGPGGPMGWRGRFKGCGYRMTTGREAILDILTVSEKHLSAEDIYRKVTEKYPGVGLTSVYRTLEILSNMGIVYKFDFGDGRARYELAEGSKKPDHHHHLVCTKCKRVIDYTEFIDEEVELLKKTEKGLSKRYNFAINNHLIQFYGLCGKCKAESPK